MKKEFFDADYFERGIPAGKSCYVNYRWIPELTIPMAMTMIDHLNIKRGQTVLDFGCAKGFLVKALRMLGREAYGFDISEYAISNCHPDVVKFCTTSNIVIGRKVKYDFCVAKDVLEHLELPEILKFLDDLNARILFIIVPLADKNQFRIPAYENDKSHITKGNEDFWKNIFESTYWKICDFTYRIEGIKDNWKEYETGNGFFILRRNEDGTI